MRIEIEKAHLDILYRELLVARFSKDFLERQHGNLGRSNGVIVAFLNVLKEEGSLSVGQIPFFEQTVSQREFHQSTAYRHLVEMGVPFEQYEASISPFLIAKT